MVNKRDIERGEHSTLPVKKPVETNIVAFTDHGEPPLCSWTTSVYQALQPLLFACTVGGLIFKKNFAVTGIKRHLSATHVYCCILLVFHITDILRWFTMFSGNETFGAFLFIKISYSVWAVECVGHYVASFIACESYHRLPEFFMEWEKTRAECSRSVKSIKKLTISCAFILSILVFANSVFSTYLTFWTNFQDLILTPWNKEYKFVVVVQIINVVHTMYLSFAWFGPSVLMFMICKILADEFKKINNRIKDLSRAEPSRYETLEGIRRQHQNLCNLVANADDIFSMQIAISFTCSLVITCLMIYLVVYNDDSTLKGAMFVGIKGFWVCGALSKVLVDCVSGAILNDGVSRS